MKIEAFLPLATYPEPNTDAAASTAVEFAAGIGASLHALALAVDIPDVSNTLSRLLLDTPGMIRKAETASRKSGEHLLDIVKEKATSAAIDATTDTIAAPLVSLGDAAAMHARYFDLSLIAWEAGNASVRMMAEAVIFGSGRPTILLPAMPDIPLIEHVAVAWDGSRVAARAVADAKFFLERASRISVITVLDEKPLKQNDAGERLATRLRDCGLAAEAVRVTAEDCPIAETLQQTALQKGCSLLVMGGYGHSRMRDFVLGGATEGVISNPRLSVLLSH
ncbi:universal stress protein [Mesorhizobium sp. IMUNJ 23232]|uniref:universal stress protein n=1 Tax=Mesorhizobium sp. IMUNJ 23232 TaxID=3376064 RepID=UPI0037B555F7